jgi:hypothetical protein
MHFINQLAAALGAVCLIETISSVQAAQDLPPMVHPDASQHVGCPASGPGGDFISAIDASEPLDAMVLENAKNIGVKVVFRYYDWKNEGTRVARGKDGRPVIDPKGFRLVCLSSDSNEKFYPELTKSWNPGESLLNKTLTAEERDTIFKHGLAIGVVFQHCNSMAETFEDQKRAAFDADRALTLAKDLRQEKQTPIFFGVDDNFGIDRHNKFDASSTDVVNIRRYFDVVTPLITSAEFIVGIYGSGSICDVVKRDHPKILCWLSQSASFAGSDAAVRDKTYDIKQCLERQWPGTKPDFDPNAFNDARPAITFWKKIAD